MFETKHASWLDKSFVTSPAADEVLVDLDESAEVPESPETHKTRGRPLIGFGESSERSKRRKIKQTRDELDPELLRRAAKPPRTTPDRALDFLAQGDFSKSQCEGIRAFLAEVDLLEVLPAYNHVREGKPKCVPVGLKVTGTVCEVPLASLLEHTSRRLLEAKSASELESLDSELTLIVKWGCDGSSGHSSYKQNFTIEGCSDESIFLTSMVPLQIHSTKNKTKSSWLNPRPASTRFCRLIKFQYVKDTEAVVLAKVRRVEEEIAKLERTEVIVRNRSFVFEYKVIFSMMSMALPVCPSVPSARPHRVK